MRVAACMVCSFRFPIEEDQPEQTCPSCQERQSTAFLLQNGRLKDEPGELPGAPAATIQPPQPPDGEATAAPAAPPTPPAEQQKPKRGRKSKAAKEKAAQQDAAQADQQPTPPTHTSEGQNVAQPPDQAAPEPNPEPTAQEAFVDREFDRNPTDQPAEPEGPETALGAIWRTIWGADPWPIQQPPAQPQPEPVSKPVSKPVRNGLDEDDLAEMMDPELHRLKNAVVAACIRRQEIKDKKKSIDSSLNDQIKEYDDRIKTLTDQIEDRRNGLAQDAPPIIDYIQRSDALADQSHIAVQPGQRVEQQPHQGPVEAAVHDMLLLVRDEINSGYPDGGPTILDGLENGAISQQALEVIKGWTAEQVANVELWASALIAKAADNEGVKLYPWPDCLLDLAATPAPDLEIQPGQPDQPDQAAQAEQAAPAPDLEIQPPQPPPRDAEANHSPDCPQCFGSGLIPCHCFKPDGEDSGFADQNCPDCKGQGFTPCPA